MMVLHRSCEGALFLGGQKRPMRWQIHRSGYSASGFTVEAADVLLKNVKLRRVRCKDSIGDKQTNAWLGAAGHALRTEWTFFKIRQALPNSVFN
ncbi:hypothetical protein IGI04_007477 [Brassica rapa subsp. trilocularis]|uniref:Uncharacterized protein n=1 Tax=Brassica rapa subsp. trilocularis TaxID=1813537 RepID=A0ABQ7NJT8_BRACM|nr:hypothetical protein IGI04_007477 [Brassica rapa subsp. trilocularis]